ncbi:MULTISPECIES: hypothetical protein [unclassified Nocardioides]|nr:hypothetical protein [Nocardioides sp. URHA0032]
MLDAAAVLQVRREQIAAEPAADRVAVDVRSRSAAGQRLREWSAEKVQL